MPTECYNLPRSIVYPEVKIVLGSSGLGGFDILFTLHGNSIYMPQ